MKLLLTLFFEFFKTGLFAVGGGMATLPFLYDMSARHPDWFSTAQLADMIAVSESSPGPIGVNMATYVGFHTAGVLGGLVATLGLAAPSVIVILIVARILKRFKDNKYVQAAFYGLRPASTGLIAAACLSVAVIALTVTDAENVSGFPAIRWQAVILAVILWLLMNLGGIKALKAPAWLKKIGKLHPVVFLAASAVVGIIFHFAS